MGLFKTYLTKEDRIALAASIAEQEAKCSGEIRVVVRHSKHWNERKLSLHDLALREFHALGMEKTRHRTGVLIFLLISERKFQILADEGIHTKVADGTWDDIAQALSSHFRQGNYRDGLRNAVVSVGSILATHFPFEPGDAGDTNELSNDVIER